MEKIWLYPEGIKQSSLLEVFNREGIDWKRQTLNTFITHLEEKGLVEREKRIVYPTLSKLEFTNHNIIEVIEDAYGGLLSNLVVAFSKKKRLTKQDIICLKQLLNEYEQEEE